MATIKHPDTFKCDVCGREIERAHSITLPVRWTTEQNEGRPCTPYVKEETIDLCDECPDGPRYKAIGNSMAVPVMRWIGERIAMAEAGEIS